MASTESAENTLIREALPGLDQAVTAKLADLERDVTALGDPAAPPLLARYTAAARAIAALLGSGDIAGALRVEQSEQGPAADGLLVEIGRFAEVQSARAHEELRRADRLSVAVHLGTVGLVGGAFALLWLVDGRAERDRRRLVEAYEARFRGVVSRGADAILLVEPSGRVQFASDSSMSVLGMAASALEGSSLLAAFEGDERPRIAEGIAAVTADHTRSAVMSLTVDAPELRFLEITMTNRLEDDAIGAIIVNVRDITRGRLTEAALARSEELAQDVFDHAPVLIYVNDLDGRYVRVNQAWADAMGCRRESVAGARVDDIFPQETAQLIMASDRSVLEGGERDDEEVITIGGRRRIFLTSRFPLVDASGTAYAVGGVSLDVTDRARLQDTEQLLGAVVSHAGDAIFTVEGERITSWNPAAEALLGYTTAQILGAAPTVLAPEALHEEHARLWAAVEAGQPIQSSETVCRHRDGTLVHVEVSIAPLRSADGRITGASAIVRDMTERRRQQKELERMERTDPLTSLPNRASLTDALAQVVNRCNLDQSAAALLYFGLDRFKLVNDSLGHAAGDEVLRVTGARLRDCLRPGDLVARHGGDEFVVICHPIRDATEAIEIASRMGASVSEPLTVGGDTLVVTVSVGVALTPAQDSTLWLRDAGMAMYEVKRSGRAGMRLLDDGMREVIGHQIALRNDLGRALDAGEITAHYQPIVDLSTERLVGFEALARWQHPSHGLVPPAEFIPLAEETGAIGAIGLEMLRQACTQLIRWERELTDSNLTMSFNLAVAQLHNPGIAAAIGDVVAMTGAQPSRLVAEITESAFADADLVGAAINEIADLGIQISIDDFGTGYSSLAYLNQFPVTRLKIDRSFVAEIGTSLRGQSLVAGVISLSHDLDLTVTAEGVETEQQARELQELGCDQGQGYLWARPGAVNDLRDTIRHLSQSTAPRGTHRGRSPVEDAETPAYMRALRLHTAGASAHTIAAVLNREGMQTSTGKQWSHTAVTRLLAEHPDP